MKRRSSPVDDQGQDTGAKWLAVLTKAVIFVSSASLCLFLSFPQALWVFLFPLLLDFRGVLFCSHSATFCF